MDWEIEDALIRLEHQMYPRGSDHSASSDRYTIEQRIKDLEQELAEARKPE